MNIRNPAFTADNRIDCEIEHPQFGWIPFTADPNDVEQHGRDIYAAALEMGPAAYIAPPPQPEPVPQSITFAHLLIGLVTEAWITEAEGEAWLAGVLPAQVTALISTLPVEQQFAAKVRAARPSEVLRMDPFVVSMGAAQGKTPEELDQFFRTYSGV